MIITILDELDTIDSTVESELLSEQISEFIHDVYNFRTKYHITSFEYDTGKFVIPTLKEIYMNVAQLVSDVKCDSWIKSGGYTVTKTSNGKIALFYGVNSVL